jgi:hypothetical protein
MDRDYRSCFDFVELSGKGGGEDTRLEDGPAPLMCRSIAYKNPKVINDERQPYRRQADD